MPTFRLENEQGQWLSDARLGAHDWKAGDHYPARARQAGGDRRARRQRREPLDARRHADRYEEPTAGAAEASETSNRSG